MLINGDALHIPLADESVQMVITSPPYYNAREYSQWESYEAYLADMSAVWRECYRVLIDGGRIAVNVPQGYDRSANGGYKPIGDHTAASIEAIGFNLRGIVIWDKGAGGAAAGATAWGSWLLASNPHLRENHEIIIVAHKGKPNREYGISTIDKDTFLQSTKSVWSVSAVQSPWHPAPFPAEIPRRLIELYTFLGDRVLDPFSGSGTTEQVANRLGRVGIGLELHMPYIRKCMTAKWHAWENGTPKVAAGVMDGLPLFGGGE